MRTHPGLRRDRRRQIRQRTKQLPTSAWPAGWMGLFCGPTLTFWARLSQKRSSEHPWPWAFGPAGPIFGEWAQAQPPSSSRCPALAGWEARVPGQQVPPPQPVREQHLPQEGIPAQRPEVQAPVWSQRGSADRMLPGQEAALHPGSPSTALQRVPKDSGQTVIPAAAGWKKPPHPKECRMLPRRLPLPASRPGPGPGVAGPWPRLRPASATS